MRSKNAQFRAVPIRVTPVTAAVATALGSFIGIDLAMAGSTPELVVSATRRDTGVQDVPYSISAISGESIENLQIRSLADISRWTPGLYQIDQGSREANQLVIRGLNASNMVASEILRNTQGDRVSTYFGETPVYINLAPVDIERIEVLRGPQGTLYGSRSLGGTVKYIPAAPRTDEMTIDGHVRSFDMSESDDLGYDVDAVINVPLIEDTLALRAVLAYMKTPGFIDQPYVVNQPGVSCPEPFFTDPGCTADDLRLEKDSNDEETMSLRTSLLWNISDKLSATLNYVFQQNESGGRQVNSRDSMAVITDPGTMLPLDIGKYASGLRFLEENERDNSIANLTLEFDLGTADLISTTSYNTYEQEGTRDQTDLLLWYGYGDFPSFSAYTDDFTDDKTLTQEVRLVSRDESSRFDYIVGAYYQDSDLQQGSRELAPGYTTWAGFPTPDDEVTFIDVQRETKELAIFGELGFDITDRWHVLAGARWFDVDDELINCIQFTMWDPAPVCDPGGDSDDDVIYKLSSDYRIGENALVYALFSQGISLGGINPGAFVPDDLRFVKPEKADNYEAGIKSEMGDGAVRINAAAFWINWDDIQVDEFIGFPITTNAGKARTDGVEIDISAALGDKWQLIAGVTLTDTRITSAGPDKDARLPGSPEETLNFGVNYQASLTGDLDLEANWQVAVQGDVTTALSGGETLSGFAVHNASVGVGNEQWQATLFANNLFDKYAVTGVRDNRAEIGTDGFSNDFALRRYFQNVLTPRTIGVDLRYRFR